MSADQIHLHAHPAQQEMCQGHTNRPITPPSTPPPGKRQPRGGARGGVFMCQLGAMMLLSD